MVLLIALSYLELTVLIIAGFICSKSFQKIFAACVMPPEQFADLKRGLLTQTDADLFLALKQGKTSALGVLYDRHAGLAYGLALKMLGDPQEAEDLVQDIFLTIAKSSYDPKRGAFRTFLAVLARSRAIDRLRSRNTSSRFWQQWRSTQAAVSESNPPFEHVSEAEQSQNVQFALSQLSDSQQQILRLSYYDGLSQSEIAEQLQLPLGTVKSLARRGLLKLRQTIVNRIE